ncbi:MAG: YdaS family helix-turn-helix protein [Mesorhizobium sp.]
MPRQSSVSPDDPRAIAWKKAQKRAGGNRKIARYFNISSPAVAMWRVCPPDRVIPIERLSGISRYELRPDIFGSEYEEPKYNAVSEALIAYGSLKLAGQLGISVEEMRKWGSSPPPELVRTIEKLTGVSRYKLRPDVFGDGPEEIAAA